MIMCNACCGGILKMSRTIIFLDWDWMRVGFRSFRRIQVESTHHHHHHHYYKAIHALTIIPTNA